MCRFVKIFFKVALGLTSALSLLITLQVQAVANGTIKPEAGLPAQSAEPQQSPGTAGNQEAEKLKQEQLREQEMQMKKRPKTRGLQQPPAAAGTKKLGGQTIRGKESPEGD